MNFENIACEVLGLISGKMPHFVANRIFFKIVIWYFYLHKISLNKISEEFSKKGFQGKYMPGLSSSLG